MKFREWLIFNAESSPRSSSDVLRASPGPRIGTPVALRQSPPPLFATGEGGGHLFPGHGPLDPTIDGADGHTITIAPRCSIAEATAVDLAHPAAQAKGAGFCILFCWVSDAHPRLTETAPTSLFVRIMSMKKCSFSMSLRDSTLSSKYYVFGFVDYYYYSVFFPGHSVGQLVVFAVRGGPFRCSQSNLACPIIVQGGVRCVLTNCRAGAGAARGDPLPSWSDSFASSLPDDEGSARAAPSPRGEFTAPPISPGPAPSRPPAPGPPRGLRVPWPRRHPPC